MVDVSWEDQPSHGPVEVLFNGYDSLMLNVGDYLVVEWMYCENRKYYGIVKEIFTRWADPSRVSYFKIYVLYRDRTANSPIEDRDELGIFPHEFKLIDHKAASTM